MANGDSNFNYPMLDGWSTADIIAVSGLYSAVATAYESGIDRLKLLAAYGAFKQVVPSKAEEKQLDREFGGESGYSIYRTIQAAKQSDKKQLKMEG